jgi:hypothetical protein
MGPISKGLLVMRLVGEKLAALMFDVLFQTAQSIVPNVVRFEGAVGVKLTPPLVKIAAEAFVVARHKLRGTIKRRERSFIDLLALKNAC